MVMRTWLGEHGYGTLPPGQDKVDNEHSENYSVHRDGPERSPHIINAESGLSHVSHASSKSNPNGYSSKCNPKKKKDHHGHF